MVLENGFALLNEATAAKRFDIHGLCAYMHAIRRRRHVICKTTRGTYETIESRRSTSARTLVMFEMMKNNFRKVLLWLIFFPPYKTETILLIRKPYENQIIVHKNRRQSNKNSIQVEQSIVNSLFLLLNRFILLIRPIIFSVVFG